MVGGYDDIGNGKGGTHGKGGLGDNQGKMDTGSKNIYGN